MGEGRATARSLAHASFGDCERRKRNDPSPTSAIAHPMLCGRRLEQPSAVIAVRGCEGVLGPVVVSSWSRARQKRSPRTSTRSRTGLAELPRVSSQNLRPGSGDQRRGPPCELAGLVRARSLSSHGEATSGVFAYVMLPADAGRPNARRDHVESLTSATGPVCVQTRPGGPG